MIGYEGTPTYDLDRTYPDREIEQESKEDRSDIANHLLAGRYPMTKSEFGLP